MCLRFSSTVGSPRGRSGTIKRETTIADLRLREYGGRDTWVWLASDIWLINLKHGFTGNDLLRCIGQKSNQTVFHPVYFGLRVQQPRGVLGECAIMNSARKETDICADKFVFMFFLFCSRSYEYSDGECVCASNWLRVLTDTRRTEMNEWQKAYEVVFVFRISLVFFLSLEENILPQHFRLLFLWTMLIVFRYENIICLRKKRSIGQNHRLKCNSGCLRE